MERFKKFMGKALNEKNVKNEQHLGSFGVSCEYLPNPIEEFDELEFRTGFQGENNIAITVTVEMGKVQRVIFGEVDEGNSDVVRSMSESKLSNFLAEKGDKLLGFFDFICV